MKSLNAINRWIDPFAPVLSLICAVISGAQNNWWASLGFFCATCYAAALFYARSDKLPQKNKPKPILNPEWESAGEIHLIAHPDSGIRCGCSRCRAHPPISKPRPDSKVLIGKIDCSGKYLLDKDGNWVKQGEP